MHTNEKDINPISFNSIPFYFIFHHTNHDFFFVSFPFLDRFRQYAGNRNKKIVTPNKRNNSYNTSKTKSMGRPKCLNNVINQQIKTSNKNTRNMTKVNNDKLLIDECGNVEEENNNINDNNNEKIVVVHFVDEWMHTFAFLSREFHHLHFIISFILTS